ncbi:MAG: bifunctional phosphopantothenoylcysteine decarboxylase/phosphopantothenate--cysteine ligase CoaBC [Alphaproteobacteria bacterium]|nr:bifunctional phosphopantothenoylcysteine decarboxylase/phosphopantothenate--cysteine ligase CoaBC [Alphaproteobacteria bacterium]
MLKDKSILLVITGGIAAYKTLDLIRQYRKAGASVRAILTKGGEQFVTPLSVSALCENQAYTDLWSLKDESEMGHIRLSREADLIVIAPASADFIAKLAHGRADDLASTCVLAADKDIMIAPAMNHKMWDNPATQANMRTLEKRGVYVTGPENGEMACGETGMGRMSEPETVFEDTLNHFQNGQKLAGLKVIVTSGPTHEPIDPVRYISNHSSGKQGHAISEVLAKWGAEVHLVSGPVSLNPPAKVKNYPVTSATDMLNQVKNLLPADIFIGVAAVADWKIKTPSDTKLKKSEGATPLTLEMTENEDILKYVASCDRRPDLVIGFAAETGDLKDKAKRKIKTKGCDWILANDVTHTNNIFGSDENHVNLIKSDENNELSCEEWPRLTKKDVAIKLAHEIADKFKTFEREGKNDNNLNIISAK